MIGYLDLPAGISGDMFLGCLVDAGWSVEKLRAAIARLKLPAGSYSIEAREVMKGPLRATLVDVRVKGEAAPPTSAGGIAIPHPAVVQRTLSQIRAIITAAEPPPAVKENAIRIFTRLAEAEAKVHGMGIEEVHFHEVGALDAIIDIVGAAAGLHELGIEKLYASPLPMGGGWTNAAHGALPLPGPATMELMALAKAPTCAGPGDGELVTPTGAAIVTTLADFSRPAMRIEKIAAGAGQRNTRWPNIARLMLGSATEADGSMRPDGETRTLVQMETNIDDMNPQFYPAVIERLLAAGARDAWITPVQMKKGRLGTVVCVLAEKDLESAMYAILLKHTTTLGVRVHDVRRHEARREMREVETVFGKVRVKVKFVGDEVAGVSPEFEDCRNLAEATGVSIQQVYDAVQREWKQG